MELKLTNKQRMNVEVIIRSKRWKDLTEVLIFNDIRNIIKLDDETQTHLSAAVGTAISKALFSETSTISLETAQVRKLKDRVEEWKNENGLAVDDLEWYQPLVAQLELKNGNPGR